MGGGNRSRYLVFHVNHKIFLPGKQNLNRQFHAKKHLQECLLNTNCLQVEFRILKYPAIQNLWDEREGSDERISNEGKSVVN